MTHIKTLTVTALAMGLAASPAAGQFTFGVNAGASLSDLTVSGVGINSQEGRRGILAGASLTLPVSGPLGLRLEGSYLQRGATFSLVQIGDVALSLDYVQVAALGRASLPLGGSRSSLYLLAGPVIAWETSCEVTITPVLQPIVQMGGCDEEALKTPTKNVDFAVSGGAGILLSLTGGMGLSLDVLYTHGLRSIYDGELGWTGHNRAVSVQAGLVFSVG